MNSGNGNKNYSLIIYNHPTRSENPPNNYDRRPVVK